MLCGKNYEKEMSNLGVDVATVMRVQELMDHHLTKEEDMIDLGLSVLQAEILNEISEKQSKEIRRDQLTWVGMLDEFDLKDLIKWLEEREKESRKEIGTVAE